MTAVSRRAAVYSKRRAGRTAECAWYPAAGRNEAMLTRDENELLTRTGPGTAMGALLRCYWIPVVQSGEVEAGGRVKRVRLLGEPLIVFRGKGGPAGVVGEVCPHRGPRPEHTRWGGRGHGAALSRGGRAPRRAAVPPCPTSRRSRASPPGGAPSPIGARSAAASSSPTGGPARHRRSRSSSGRSCRSRTP